LSSVPGVPGVPDTGSGATDQPSVRGSRLDPFVDLYAERARTMIASEIRALFSVAARPEVVSLAGGMPYVSALPLDAVADTFHRLIAEHGAAALQYGSGQGAEALREQIAGLMMPLVGVTTHPDDVVVTVGSQQALDLVTRILCDPGDVVLAEAPSYVGALSVFAAYQTSVVHVAMDAQGLLPEALREALARLAAQGRRPKFLYTIPSFHNPAGVTQDPARRAEILEIAVSHGVPVLEDDPYALLGFDGVVPRALRADDGEHVLYLGSFSKTFASGMRVGWVVAPHGVREKLVLAAEASVLCPSELSQLAISAYLTEQPWWDQVKVFRELYRERRDALLEAMATQLPTGTTWTVPDGGFYSWVQLPAGLDATTMLARAVTARVAYVPGSAFYAGAAKELGRGSLRLSYCYPDPDRIREGVRRLASVVTGELELLATFGPGSGSRGGEGGEGADGAAGAAHGGSPSDVPGPATA
jgi:DNA-binding transcriptional MocR family regulator